MTNLSTSTSRSPTSSDHSGRTGSDRLRGAVFGAALAVWGSIGAAQGLSGGFDVGTVQSPVLVIEFEKAFSQSAYGQQFAVELEKTRAEIVAENRRIEAELTREELELTERRPQMEPAEFRELASAFDQKVQKLRNEQDAKSRAVNDWQERARREFLEAAGPVLNGIMRESGAVAILEKRNVFFADSAIDVTEQVIEDINETLELDAGSLVKP